MNYNKALLASSLLIAHTMISPMFLMSSDKDISYSCKRKRTNNKIVFFNKKKKPDQTNVEEIIQNIPRRSLEQIETYVTALPHEDFQQIKNQLSHSFTFNIAVLPRELRSKIVISMFNGNEQLAEFYYKTPLWYACANLHEAHKAVSLLLLPKEEAKQLTLQFFELPYQQKKIIMNTIRPNRITKFFYKTSTISAESLALIDGNMVKYFFNKRDILKVSELEEKNLLRYYIKGSLGIGAFFLLATTLCFNQPADFEWWTLAETAFAIFPFSIIANHIIFIDKEKNYLFRYKQ